MIILAAILNAEVTCTCPVAQICGACCPEDRPARPRAFCQVIVGRIYNCVYLGLNKGDAGLCDQVRVHVTIGRPTRWYPSVGQRRSLLGR